MRRDTYECLWWLENKISQMRGTLSPRIADMIQPSERGVEIAAQVVRSYGDYTREPAVLAARRQVIAELLGVCLSSCGRPENSSAGRSSTAVINPRYVGSVPKGRSYQSPGRGNASVASVERCPWVHLGSHHR